MFAFHIPRHMTKWRGTKAAAAVRTMATSSRKQRATVDSSTTGKAGCAFQRLLLPRKLNAVKQTRAFRRTYTTASFKAIAAESPILLRDACHCSRCVDQSTHQREFSYADIPTNISVSSIEPDSESGTWKVKWENDIAGYNNHVSVFHRSALTQLLDGIPSSLDVHRTISLWDQSKFAEETKDVNYEQLLHDDGTLTTALELIQRHGLIFVTDIPEDEEAVRKMLVRLTGLFRNTFYGESWNVRSVPQAKNVAYTSADLGFHMDLLYMKEPPGLQLLHCLQNSCRGGESEFADTFKAIDVLRQEQPRYVDRLVKSKIRYGYSNDGHFYSDDKPVIKTGNGKHLPLPRILNATDADFMETVECVYWSPPFINSIANAAHDGDTKEFIEASKAFVEVMQRPELIYETKLPAGTCAVFDNLRVVHARKAFDINSGSRWLKGMYGDRQDVLSKSLKHVWSK